MPLVLNVEPRKGESGHANRVRAEGLVPGVVYGQGKQATSLQFKELELLKLLRSGGVSQLIELHGLGSATVYSLLREVQRHPTRRTITHVDFYQVQMDVAVRTEVPIHMEGESPAIKGGAVIIHHLDRIHVECLPGDIPDYFKVDLSTLVEIDDVVRVSALAVPKGVTIHQGPDDVVISLSLPRVLAEAEEGAGEEGAPVPEVIRKSKGEES